jgi:outer membrane protein OmpA-like peptidoglycan-associated protein
MPVTILTLVRPAAWLAALLLAGCASAPVPPPVVPPPVSAAPLPAPGGSATAAPGAPGTASPWAWSPRLDSAARSLRSSLGGSGIEVVQTTDQRLWVSLPGAETFPLGRSALTRPAGAWLDQVAAAVKGMPQAEVQIVGQPDARQAGGSALAIDRAQSARDWMVMRGVPARRVAVSGQTAKGKTPDAESRLDILIGERGKSTPP